jgi:glycosyltransferase involved in cell wall biosynthesis
MQVLHNHSGNLYGGVETLLRTLAEQRSLCPEMEPQFALCFDGRIEEELRSAGVVVHSLGNVRVSRPSGVRRARRALAEVLRSVPYDLVVCHSSWSHAIFGRVVQEAGLPLVRWMHDASDGTHWLDRWSRRTSPELIVCNSRFTARSGSQLFPQVRTEVVYYPITNTGARLSTAERAAIRDELNTGASDAVIIQVSRMEALKGHSLHLDALSLLQQIPGWTCWMVGGAQRPAELEYLTTLKRQADRLGIADRISFAGECADVPKLLAASDIFCQPNLSPESFGISFIEALSAGLPTVTTNIGGAREIIDDSCGVLLPEGDAQALARALRELIENPERRNDLGRNGPGRARQLCDPATQMNRLHHLFVKSGRSKVAA